MVFSALRVRPTDEVSMWRLLLKYYLIDKLLDDCFCFDAVESILCLADLLTFLMGVAAHISGRDLEFLRDNQYRFYTVELILIIISFVLL